MATGGEGGSAAWRWAGPPAESRLLRCLQGLCHRLCLLLRSLLVRRELLHGEPVEPGEVRNLACVKLGLGPDKSLSLPGAVSREAVHRAF